MICCSRASSLCLVHRSTFLSSPGRASQCQFVSGKTKIKTHTWSILSRLVLISGFMLMERCVIEGVKRSPHQQPDTGRDARFEAQKSEAALRTCVYSRYAGLKTPIFKRFCRSQATPGLAVDYRQSHQDNGFCGRKGAATISTARQIKTTIF